MAQNIDAPNIDPKKLAKQNRKKIYEQINKERLDKKKAKQEKRKKIHEEYLQQNSEIDKIENKCKQDIKDKLAFFKQQVVEKKMDKKTAKAEFKAYRKERINQFSVEEQNILNLSSDELKQSFSFRMKRWFFGVGKEFSRVTWIGGKEVLKDFGIILLIVGIMTLIFLGLDYLIGIIPKK